MNDTVSYSGKHGIV